MKVGETRTVTMDDMGMIGTLNAMLREKLGGQPATNGGTHKRLTEDISPDCGFYTDLNDTNSPITPFAIITDKKALKAIVYAPITGTEQEAKGCWPGSRARMNALTKKIDRLLQAHK